MPLVRLVLLCLAVALAAQPSRATPVCPLPSHRMHATQAACDHANAPQPGPHRSRAWPMACCTPVGVTVATPALASRHQWRTLSRTRPAAERDREDAALGPPLEPPRSA